jgi:hypothetical protein
VFLDLRDMADREEKIPWQRNRGHMQQTGKLASAPPNAERRNDDAHVFDRE